MLTVLLTEHGRIADSAALQRVMRIADHLPSAAARLDAMLCDTFDGVTAGHLPAAALLREWQCGDAGTRFWVCAEPAVVQAEMITARLLASGADTGLDESRSREIAAALTPLCADHGWLLDAPSPERWYLSRAAAVETPPLSSPREALGDDLGSHLPSGTSGRPWRQLFNDVQVEIHNLTGAPGAASGQMNALWFWGAGQLPAALGSNVRSVFSDDALLHALAAAAQIDAQAEAMFPSGLGQDALIDLRRQRGDVLEQSLLALVGAVRTGSTLLLRLESGERLRLRGWHRWRMWRRG